MPKFHTTKNGQAAECHATDRACPLGGEHYDSMKDAVMAQTRAFGQAYTEFEDSIDWTTMKEKESVSEEDELESLSETLGAPFEGPYDASWLDSEDPEEWASQFDWLSPDSLRANAPSEADPAQVEEDMADAQDYLRLVVAEARKRGKGWLVPLGF